MKILHTSDWHLGKKLYKISRLDEQLLFLSWVHKHIVENEIKVLIIAGDIYDTPNPPADAIRAFYDFLHKLNCETNCHVLVIAGNHDSGAFLETTKNILSDKNITIIGKLSGTKIPSVIIEDVEFHFLPFFRSYEIFQIAKEQNIDFDDDEAQITIKTLEAIIENGIHPNVTKRILIAHHIFGNFERIEMGGSEQVIALSGLDSIPNTLLEKYYDYVALGHIHKKATLSENAPIIRYSGAPIPFRFSENYKKGVTEIRIGDNISFHEIEIPCFRSLHSIKCSNEDFSQKIDSIVSKTTASNELSPLLEIIITSENPIIGVADVIREKLTNCDHELISLKTIIKGTDDLQKDLLMQGIPAIEELFDMFYRSKHPDSDKIPDPIHEEFLTLLAEVQNIDEVMS